MRLTKSTLGGTSSRSSRPSSAIPSSSSSSSLILPSYTTTRTPKTRPPPSPEFHNLTDSIGRRRRGRGRRSNPTSGP